MEKQTQFNVFKLMKKVQSAYSFSLLLFSSSLVLLILHIIKSYSMINIVSVMKFNIDRNHVFLICNGILVILVKSSSSLSSSSSSLDSNSSYNSINNAVQNDQSLPKSTVLSDQRKQEEIPAVTSEQKVTTTTTTDVKMDSFLTVEDNVHVQEEKLVFSECEVLVNDNDVDHQEDDHDDDEGEDAEELNKRCEEFIRRMKQGIISESRKDLGLARFS